MFDLIVLADIGQTIKEYISKNLIPSWLSFVVQFAALVILVLVVFFVAYKPVRKMLTKRADYVEKVGDGIAENYKNDFKSSVEVLQSDNPPYVRPRMDGRPSDDEPHIAIKGAPIEKTFTDVVNSSATTDITSVRTDSKKAPVYDLSGKQVTGDLQKGQVYI